MKLPATAWIAVVAIFASVIVAFLNKWWDPIAEHLGYPFGASRCLEELHAKVKTLSTMQSDLCYEDPSPSSAERRGWAGSVKDLVKKEQEMKDRLAKGHLSYLKMCKLGREAEMELKKASDLITQGGRLMPKVKTSHTRRSDRLLPEVEESPHTVQLKEQPVPNPLPGMENTYYKVLNFIKDNRPESVIMGIWGMGGVGKTVLTNLVRDSGPLYHDYFLEVVLVQPGKGCTEVADLQKAIAIRMELDQIDNEISQAEIIRRHLHNKNFLFLVDDLWKYLNLEDVGIPLFDGGPHRRKVVFTTRSRDVCTNMRCLPENTIQMKCLKKEEAWNLFEKYVRNTIIDHAEIHELAKEIVEECSGLPMALCRIGEIMSSKKDPREWRAVIDLLKKSKLHEIPNCHEDLFKRLQESYDNLPAAMKERFLLCSLWPEKENISMRKLIRLWTGLGLLDGLSNASDVGYTFINYLVHASMLEKGDTGLDSRENSHVKMHNMTRMMAIGIVNEHGNKNKWLPNSLYRSALPEEMWCTVEKAWVSQEDTSRWCQWSSEARFPVLKMLLAQHVFSLQLISFFQNITFLDLEGVKRKEFPSVICKLAELQHLNLSATAFSFLDPLLAMLTKLKHLYIRNNMDLQEIPKGLILGLKRLRVLDLFSTGASFPNILEELERSATDLDMLGFTVRTVGEITKLEQLKRVCTQALCMYQFEGMSDLDTVNLQFLAKLRELRELTILHCCQSEKILVAEGGGPKYNEQLLPHLEIFELNNLRMLEKVTWKNAGMNIRVVNIYRCDGLKDVTWVHHLKSLEQLTVAHCQEMERLIETGELPQGVDLNQTVAIIIPLLKKLELIELPKLCMISHQACEFKELSYISVTRCDQMKGINNQVYKQRISIYCSEDWWENSKSAGTSNPYLVPICS